jgi:hypothetical protein
MTEDDLLDYLDLRGLEGGRELQTEAVEIWNDNDSVYHSTIKVTKSSIIIDQESDDTTTTSPSFPIELPFSSYSTISDITSRIEDYDGWITLSYVNPSTPSEDLAYMPSSDCSSYEERSVLISSRANWIDRLIERVSSFISVWCHRDFCYHKHVELLDGDGKDLIYLSDFPVHNIQEIRVNGEAWSSGDDFTTDQKSGIVEASNFWPEGYQNIRIEYWAGFKTIPQSLKDLACSIAAIFYHSWGSNPKLTLEKIGTYRMEVLKGFLTPDIVRELESWMRWDM